MKHILKGLIAGALLVLSAQTGLALEKQEAARWSSFITLDQLKAKLDKAGLLLIDARSAEEYSKGHIPEAISLPGTSWRTGKAKPGQGDSQYVFRRADGSPDITRYEQFLGQAGVSNEHDIVVYGNFGGKKDGSLPAFLLRWLGHEKVSFLDGKGFVRWQKAGLTVSTEDKSLPKTSFKASPRADWIWDLEDVSSHLGNDKVVFYDTRSKEEFTGENKRSNKFGGHIPGAVLLDYRDFLDADKGILPVADVKQLLNTKGITPDKTIVLYCQTATRITLPALALLDLGYLNLAVYDASWHEYGNRDDTKIARATR